MEREYDPDDAEERAFHLSTILVRDALRIRQCLQDTEEAGQDLATDVFCEILTALPAEDRLQFEGEARIHTPASMTMNGHTPCKDWEVRYTATLRQPEPTP